MIKIQVHSTTEGLRNEIPLSSISDVLSTDGNLLWIDVEDPTADDLTLLANEFGFHPLAIEDVSRRHQRPKVDNYDKYMFIVFYAVLPITTTDPLSPPLRTVEINLFVGANYLVTAHREPLPLIDEIGDRWSQNLARLSTPTTSALVYSVLDAVVDGYFPIVDAIAERVEDLEQLLFDRFDPRAQSEIFRLKKDLLAVRRVLAPEREVMNILLRRDSPLVDDESIVYLQDVYDHIIRVTDSIDTYRDLLSAALDAYLSITSNRLNEVMKRLTASSIILMSVTVVASVYGMNYDHMPELHWRLGYLWALGLMASVGIGLAIFFRKVDYF